MSFSHKFSSNFEATHFISYYCCGEISTPLIKENSAKDNTDSLMIRCRTSLLKKSIKATTHIDVNQFSFQWLVNEPNSTDRSENYKVPMLDKTHIQVIMTAPENDIMVSIRKSSYVIPQVVKCKISLVDDTGMARYSKTDAYFFDCACDIDTWKFPSFLTKDLLKSKIYNFLSNGSFTLILNFSISNGLERIEIDNKAHYNKFPLRNGIERTSLQDDLYREFISKELADVELIVGDKKFPAHKSILSMRSAFFKEIVYQNNERGYRRSIDVTDIDSESMEMLLKYIYTDVLDNDIEYNKVLKLLMAAIRYKIPSLIKKCYSEMPHQNVCKTLEIADLMECELLKASVYSYIADNAKSILASKEWADLVKKNPKFAVEIIPNLLK